MQYGGRSSILPHNSQALNTFPAPFPNDFNRQVEGNRAVNMVKFAGREK